MQAKSITKRKLSNHKSSATYLFMDNNDLFEPGQQILLFPSCSALPAQRCSLSSLTKQHDTQLYPGRAVQVHESAQFCADFHTSVLLKHSTTFQAHCSHSSLLVTLTQSLCSRRNLNLSCEEVWFLQISPNAVKNLRFNKLSGDEASLLQLSQVNLDLPSTLHEDAQATEAYRSQTHICYSLWASI